MRSSLLKTVPLKPITRPRPRPSFKMSTGVPSSIAQTQKATEMNTSTSAPSTSSLGIESTDIQTAAGVELNTQQRVIIGSVLDVSYTNENEEG